ncbi:MAG: low molecular weight protein-tyrosine-phosphatase [Anaerolineae bacterium]|uniref:low molecular weight protein-tyrosine-phosphatase n=1 Tax=Chloroflexota TaxID=200795 RepID=UPI001E19BCF7|nr:low molecular weight phosphotyrosine protein phosphatase [Anaerolineae bacterium]MBK7202319.1 low molecular weight phosphotyrosine protein phosphatase [Anaerolineae bacterium]MBK9094771.1 low molecular weight phosphotyrosine protein phosphatase [Anaerolineae bacterium]MBK9613312.1 low molecular weight phosphotyrosine protein phosphatase [Dehalococcoidia bacterium]
MIQVLFICLGNICRSPMAEAVFRHLVTQAGLQDRIEILSAGASQWHVGEPAHRGTLAVLRQADIAHQGRARQVTPADLRAADYIVTMDQDNIYDLQRLDLRGDLDGKTHRLMEFAPANFPRDIPDPYYDNNFDYTYKLVVAGCRGLLAFLQERGMGLP